ncbi:hypothetical protein KCP69_23825 [Salmonella enterica subsp. enterica]|nr:hypothetical protein KCP69_23825 [Salmonella enterica subsp. enterica]
MPRSRPAYRSEETAKPMPSGCMILTCAGVVNTGFEVFALEPRTRPSL